MNELDELIKALEKQTATLERIAVVLEKWAMPPTPIPFDPMRPFPQKPMNQRPWITREPWVGPTPLICSMNTEGEK